MTLASPRIDNCFAALYEQRRTALIPFITAGDPDAGTTLATMHALVTVGADIIELGMPFSDPMADGPVIQKAGERALAAGMTLRGVLDLVAEFRRDNDTTPVVLMGYLNPIEAMGYRAFAERSAAVGVDGVLVVDLPAEESTDFLAELDAKQLAPIFLLAPTSTEERIKRVAECARGYVYYVSLKGVTGSAALDVVEVEDRLVQIREFIKQLPLGVGFGIKNAATAAAIARFADAVVVGSAIVDKIARLGADKEAMLSEVSALVGAMREAMDAV